MNPELKKLTVPRLTEYIPFEPTAKQSAFLLCMHRDLFYGGEAGGGKSVAILMGALQFVDLPGYHALIIRRTYQDLALPKAIMHMALEWLLNKPGVHWNKDTKCFTFPSGSTLTFGYMQNGNDHLQYQGAAFHYIGFDEATQIPIYQIKYMFSRNRRPKEGPGSQIPLRFRTASNPGGLSHNEMKARYVDSKLDHFDEHTGEYRIFISAGMDDNPYLDVETYKQNLMQLPALEREQLLHGDWEIRVDGKVFQRQWFEIVDELPADIDYWVRYWDMASTEPHKKNRDPDWTVGCLMGYSKVLQKFFIKDIIRTRKPPAITEQIIKQTAQLDGKEVEIWEEQEPGSSGVTVISARTKLLAGYIYEGDRVTGKKWDRWKPMSSQAAAGNVVLLKANWNAPFLDEAEIVPDGPHDDQIDAGGGAFTKLAEKIDNGEIYMEWI